jgi:hypothetical protein
LVGSVIYQDVLAGLTSGQEFAIETDRRAYNVDLQHIYSGPKFRIQSGLLAARETEQEQARASFPDVGPVLTETRTSRQLGLYTYVYFEPLPTVTVTAGLSFDDIDNPFSTDNATSPKLGVVWRPTPYTTVRAAWFETLFGSLTTSTQNAQPRLEPVHVAGFTQQLFGGTADHATVNGVALEQELSPRLFVGWQGSDRRTQRTGVDLASGGVLDIKLREKTQKAHFQWMPLSMLSVVGYYEHGRYGSEPIALFGYADMKTTRLPIEIRYFSRKGFTIGARESYVHQ